jgi:lysozyme
VPGPSAKKSSSKKLTHTVRRGEALSVIASKYGVKQSDIMRWNKIRNANRVYAGQKLVIYASASTSSWTTYTVRSGDSLGRIAQRQGCSVADLKSWNSLRSSTIHPGQKLKVRR